MTIFAEKLNCQWVFYNLMDNAVAVRWEDYDYPVFLERNTLAIRSSYAKMKAMVSLQRRRRRSSNGDLGRTPLSVLFLAREILSITGITLCETGELGILRLFTAYPDEGGFPNYQSDP